MIKDQSKELPPGIVVMANGDEARLLSPSARTPDRWEVSIHTPRLKSHRKLRDRGLFWDAGGPNE
jgi:hypothetical protein